MAAERRPIPTHRHRTEPSAVRHDMDFTTTQVIKAVPGVTYRMLDYWAREGILVPTVAEATGSGSSRLYSFHDVIAVRLLHTLREAGVMLGAARRAAVFVQSLPPEVPVDDTNLLVAGDRVALVRVSDGALLHCEGEDPEDPVSLLVDLGRMVEDSREAVAVAA